ncbi:MAG: alpha/beta hydrolase [Lachnospiraceae bacterium]|jgi:enterochelin esterase-like enzyme
MRNRHKWRAAAALFLSAALLVGCGSETGYALSSDSETASASVSDTSSDLSTDSGSGLSTAFSDTDYSVEDGYADVHDGVDYGTLIEGVTYTSTAAGTEKKFNILLPTDYDETKTYPVLYLLHGIDGDPYEWSVAPVIYGNLVAENKARPAILVFVDMWTSSKTRSADMSESERRAVFHQFYKDLGNDLIPYVNSHYAVAAGMKNTAILGMSTGAAEAVNDVVRLPGVFGYLGVLAPEADIFTGSGTEMPVLESVTFESPDEAPLYTFFCIGSECQKDKEDLAVYEKQFDAAGVSYASWVIEGADHDASVWTKGFYNFARRIFKD